MLDTTDDPEQRAGDFSRSAEEIRNDIELKKQAISETVDQLNERLHEGMDWRSYVRRHPFLALGVAAGLGFFVSGKLVKPQTPVEKIADTIQNLTGKAKEQSLIKLALYSLGTKIVSDLLKSASAKEIINDRPSRLTGDLSAPRTKWNHVH
jgi:ElaB/YqjD/DUF883 family membrane-anchored ribosome-binding protein